MNVIGTSVTRTEVVVKVVVISLVVVTGYPTELVVVTVVGTVYIEVRFVLYLFNSSLSKRWTYLRGFEGRRDRGGGPAVQVSRR